MLFCPFSFIYPKTVSSINECSLIRQMFISPHHSFALAQAFVRFASIIRRANIRYSINVDFSDNCRRLGFIMPIYNVPRNTNMHTPNAITVTIVVILERPLSIYQNNVYGKRMIPNFFMIRGKLHNRAKVLEYSFIPQKTAMEYFHRGDLVTIEKINNSRWVCI